MGKVKERQEQQQEQQERQLNLVFFINRANIFYTFKSIIQI